MINIIIIDINVIIAITIKNIITIFKNIGIFIIGSMMMFYRKERGPAGGWGGPEVDQLEILTA